MNECVIKWNSLSVAEWQDRFAMIPRSNLLQSYDYARAVCPLQRQKARWGLVMMDGQEAGLVQILEAGLFGHLFHAVILDRGPLWFDGFGTAGHIESFFKAFNKAFPRRFGRKRRIIPESGVFQEKNYEKLDNPGYQTIWVDLRSDEETLRARLKQKWRNMLNKAEKKGLELEWDENIEFFPRLLMNYQEDKAKKGYDGPSVKMLMALVDKFAEDGNVIIGKALLDNKVVSAILILCHGTSATYQVGWTSEEGRDTAAQNLLLWQALCHLKEKTIYDFDLGGINDESAKNIRKFKEGLGGEIVELAGQYS